MKSQIDSLTAAFERLSGREQIMTLFMVISIFAFLLGMSTYFVQNDLVRRSARIAAKEKKLVLLQGLRADYQRRLADQNRLAAEIQKNNSTRLLSYLETVSKQANTEIRNAAERTGQAGATGNIREVAAEVSVQNVSIDRLYDFLKRIEGGNRLIKVRKLEIKSRFDNPKMLDAKVTVGTFKVAEG
jgi:hypothetical protein